MDVFEQMAISKTLARVWLIQSGLTLLTLTAAILWPFDGKETVMLVLSRRPNEKILFPGVGISVEIVQTKGNTVRVGIEAPEDIRILRGELEQREVNNLQTLQQERNSLMQMNKVSLTSQTDPSSFNDDQRSELETRIHEIGMALALAQNQQQQGLSEYVGRALEQAIDRLNELKGVLASTSPPSELVCESRPVYSTRREQEHTLVIDQDSEHAFRLEFELVG